MSGGRFVLGLGCGWNEPEFQAFGFEFERNDAAALIKCAQLFAHTAVGWLGSDRPSLD
ncbi:hypothetical protein BH24CHL5_BH24CHL5_05750 [soil metagenome]